MEKRYEDLHNLNLELTLFVQGTEVLMYVASLVV
jgi:hypothetical protein